MNELRAKLKMKGKNKEEQVVKFEEIGMKGEDP